MKFPKISVVTPTLNQGNFIEETILSVLGQNYPNLEYIIIDGGSTDNTLEIIKKYDNRITFWSSEKDGGLYYAIQKGFEKSSGDIMCWINSDDILLNRTLFTVAELFNEFPDMEWLTGNHTFIDEQSRIVRTIPTYPLSKIKFYTGPIKWIQQESTFWKRTLWNKAGARINTSLKLAGDYDLWLTFFQHSKLYTVETSLAGFRYRTQNQKTLEQYEDYLAEAEKQRKAMQLSEEDLALLKKETFYKNLIFKIPLFPRIAYLRKKYTEIEKKLYDAPPKIFFCRKEYAFKNK